MSIKRFRYKYVQGSFSRIPALPGEVKMYLRIWKISAGINWYHHRAGTWKGVRILQPWIKYDPALLRSYERRSK